MVEHIQGIVKFFIEEKGYGFISPVDGSKDISLCIVLDWFPVFAS